VREWLIEKGFQGKEGQTIPEMTPEFINTISQRYIQLYEKLTGLEFEAAETTEIDIRINRNLELFLKQNPEP
jgi:phosphoribosylaminoimidazole-succinocarboxamide synthase